MYSESGYITFQFCVFKMNMFSVWRKIIMYVYMCVFMVRVTYLILHFSCEEKCAAVSFLLVLSIL